jgi:hypothetical protein
VARFNEMQIVSGGATYAPSANDYTQTLLSINSTSSSFAAFFMAQEDVTITHLGASYSLRTGTPPTQRISLRHAEDDGLVGAGILASKTFTPPADTSWDGTFQWIELLNPYSADRGEKLVMVLEYISGAVSNSNRSRYFVNIGASRLQSGHYPYGVTNNGSQVRSGNAPIFGYKSSSRSYGLPLKSISELTVNSPGEAGLRFLLDRGFGSTFRLLGASWLGRLSSTSGQTVSLVLYDASGDELHRIVKDADQAYSTTSHDHDHSMFFDDATLEELEFGQEYFLVLAPGGASTNTLIRCFDLEDSSDMTALRGGSGMYLVTRASTGVDFTRDRSRRPIFTDLHIDGWSA